jgi:hypothetical protein
VCPAMQSGTILKNLKMDNCLQEPTVEIRGGDFDWDNWAGLPPAELAKQRASTAALLETPESPIRQLLHGLKRLMQAPPGRSCTGCPSGCLACLQSQPSTAPHDGNHLRDLQFGAGDTQSGADMSHGAAPDLKLAIEPVGPGRDEDVLPVSGHRYT